MAGRAGSCTSSPLRTLALGALASTLMRCTAEGTYLDITREPRHGGQDLLVRDPGQRLGVPPCA
ncbi:hypothetical protein QJS66_06710 [Kocuria rhizophila]|nr:hypothetical protein QJS66_06710 [Kocuria rhizophila]